MIWKRSRRCRCRHVFAAHEHYTRRSDTRCAVAGCSCKSFRRKRWYTSYDYPPAGYPPAGPSFLP